MYMKKTFIIVQWSTMSVNKKTFGSKDVLKIIFTQNLKAISPMYTSALSRLILSDHENKNQNENVCSQPVGCGVKVTAFCTDAGSTGRR